MENSIKNESNCRMYETYEAIKKTNNRNLILVSALFATIFIGHAIIMNHNTYIVDKQNDVLKVANKSKDSLIYQQQLVISIQEQCLDSAVYFKDILINN